MNYQLYINIALLCYLLSAIFFMIFAVGKNEWTKKTAYTVYFTGIILLIIGISISGISSGHIPLSNTYETIIFMSLIIALSYLFIRKADNSGLIAFGVSVLVLILLAASSFLEESPHPLVPALKSNWLTIHVSFSFFSYAAFAMAFVVSIIYLLSGKKDKDSLDILSYKTILFGFPFLTLGIVTGAVWANIAWGSYWSWDPKETWALITWVVYGIYLHLRLQRGWKGTKCAWLSIAAFGFVIFTYFGVNYLLSGLHSYK